MSEHHPSRLLASFRNLHGGQFGTLDVRTRKHDHVELALGGDYVTLTKHEWTMLRRAIDKHYGFIDTLSETERVISTIDAEGRPVTIKDTITTINSEPGPRRDHARED